ncbi:MAG: ATP-binding cassette domain-containing protein [Desulfobacteraceae bacterium]|nr:ATP-binding cassette domain-containing protein [Desulfobacteraceae bacterium]
MLRVDGVRVSIKGFIILRGVSLDIPSSGLVGLVGRNGAGKTTTLKSIMGIMPVSSGIIDLDGQDLTQIPGHRRARMGIGYMPEERRLIGKLSVRDNILMPAWASGLEGENERLDYIYNLMPEVKKWADNKATQLSGGQQKVVALARALMNGKKLLLLDEPFEGLSPGLGMKLGQTIQSIQKEGLSILIAESDDKRLDFIKNLHTIERGELLQATDQNAEG